MPRASRHFLPGYVWHITHRCHQRKFLIKFARDRRRYLYWLFEAKKRYGLSVLNYVVTSNHVHLMVKDTGANVIAESMQLINCGTHSTRIQPAQRSAGSILGRPLSCHRDRGRRASASVCCLHRLEHGSGYRTLKPVPVVPNVQPLRSVQDVLNKQSFEVQCST